MAIVDERPAIDSGAFEVWSPLGRSYHVVLQSFSELRLLTTGGLSVSRIGPGHYRIHGAQVPGLWFGSPERSDDIMNDWGIPVLADIDAYTDHDPIRRAGE